MKICKKCNLSYEDTVVFCPKCETTLEDAEPLETTDPTETTESGKLVLEKPVKKGGNILPVIALICSVFSVQCWCPFGGVRLTALASVAVVLAVIALVTKIGSKGIAIASIGIAIMGILINLVLIWAYNSTSDTEFRDTFKTFWEASSWYGSGDSYEELLFGDIYEDM